MSVITSQIAAKIAHRYLSRKKKERKLCFFLDSDGEFLALQYVDIVSNQNMCAWRPQDVIDSAKAVGSAKIILVHNHPSGSIAMPSPADCSGGACLKELFNSDKIELVDDLVVGTHEYYSAELNKAWSIGRNWKLKELF